MVAVQKMGVLLGTGGPEIWDLLLYSTQLCCHSLLGTGVCLDPGLEARVLIFWKQNHAQSIDLTDLDILGCSYST